MLFVDKFSRIPIYEQLVEAMEREIMTGVMKVGGQLPSLRELSSSLSINPNTIQKAYAELSRRGIICASPGSGYYVTPDALDVIRHEKETQLDTLEATIRELAKAGIARERIAAILERVYSTPEESKEELK